MKAHIKQIIDAMEPDLRVKAEAAASEAGKSLETLVEDSLSEQLSDEQLDSISGGLTRVAADDQTPLVRGEVRNDRFVIGFGGNV